MTNEAFSRANIHAQLRDRAWQDVDLVLLATEFGALKHRKQRRKDRGATPVVIDLIVGL